MCPVCGLRTIPYRFGKVRAHNDLRLERQESARESSPLETLIAKWRQKAASVDSFHATMGTGWHVCAEELEAILNSAATEHETAP